MVVELFGGSAMALRTSSFHLLFLCFQLAATRTSDAAGSAAQLQAIDCSTADNDTATDPYAANLNQLLAGLPTNTVAKNGGFFHGTVGQGAATVYGLALCSVDFSRSDCNDCLTAASSSASGLLKLCPGSVTVSAIFDQCIVRYSNTNFFGTAVTDIKVRLNGDQFVPLKQSYSNNLTQGFAYLSAQAANSPERFAASATAPYALVQCTWDLPSDKCKMCIDTLSANASDLFEVAVDGERKSYSCTVRYSNSSFTVVPLVDPTGGPHSSSVGRNSSKAIVAGAVAGAVVVVVSTMITVFFWVTRQYRSAFEHKHLREVETSTSETDARQGEEVLQEALTVLEGILERKESAKKLPLQLFKSITQDFSDERKIGEGGFGKVYKGVFQKWSVAVKRINPLNDTLFNSEVECLLRLTGHPNVVRFLGFCAYTDHDVITTGPNQNLLSQEIERILCFEYISNGSLDKHITDELRGLEWNRRYQIIKGICNGLQYLHEKIHIIHMDLKPTNIMINNDMEPKITDFGVARSDEKTLIKTAHPISRGYCAPESENGREITMKYDVYSLGIIIKELVTGRKSIPDKNNVLRRWRHRSKISEMHKALVQGHQVNRCIELAEECTESEPERRPSLSHIISTLHEKEDTNFNISSHGLINPYWDDDMLGIKPLELRFGFKKHHKSCDVELNNETGNCVAFNINTTESKLRYRSEPNMGIVGPQSKRTVKITLQAQIPRDDEFIVQSTKVESAAADRDIREDMFLNKPGKVVDEVSVMVVCEDSERQQVDSSHEASSSSESNV